MTRTLLLLAAGLVVGASALAAMAPADYPAVTNPGAAPFQGSTAVVVVARRKALLKKAVTEDMAQEECASLEAVDVRPLPMPYVLPPAARDADAHELWVLTQCGSPRGYVVTVGTPAGGRDGIHIWAAGPVAADGTVAPLATVDSITPAAIRAQYDRVKARVGTEYHVRHLLVATQAQAQDALDRIHAGQDFGSVAAQVSIDTGSAHKGGDLDWAVDRSYVGPFAQALRDLAPRGLSPQPVRTAFGWHVIEVLDVRPARLPAFEDVMDKIAESMRNKIDEGL